MSHIWCPKIWTDLVHAIVCSKNLICWSIVKCTSWYIWSLPAVLMKVLDQPKLVVKPKGEIFN